MLFDNETMKVKICKTCKGIGWIDPNTKCPDCGGTGRMVHEKNQSEYTMDTIENGNLVFDPETMKIKICKECKGLGYIVSSTGDKIKCSECNGHGRYVDYNIKSEHTMNEFSDIPSDDKK